MAKKLKFPLVLKDDYQVRTLEELREYFDLEKVLSYYRNGRLLIWLEDRYYQNESEGLRGLNERESDFVEKLCKLLGVAYIEDQKVDLESLLMKQARLEKLKQYTSDTSMVEKLDLMKRP